MAIHVGRRKLIVTLGGAAAWPLAARAQQDTRVRRIGWLATATENDTGAQSLRTALREELGKLGWIEGRNLRIDLRFGGGDLDRIRAHAAELVRLVPDVIIGNGGVTIRVVQQATQTIPIIFTTGGDPVANGLVRNLARPEGNTTGFSVSEPSIAGKRLELLKEAAPHVSRVAVLFNPDLAATGPSYIAALEAAAPALVVQIVKTPVHDAVDIVHAIDTFAATPNGGLLVLPPQPTPANLNAILRLAARHRLPAVYGGGRGTAALGGLMTYSTDFIDLHRRAATYVDRLLRGAKVSELPVQFPTKFQLVINLKTAKAIGLDVPDTLRARAEVIE